MGLPGPKDFRARRRGHQRLSGGANEKGEPFGSPCWSYQLSSELDPPESQLLSLEEPQLSSELLPQELELLEE